METAPPILFDRARLRKHQLRAAPHFAQHDFLWREAALRAEESLSYLACSFPRMVVFGGQHFTPPEGTAQLIHAALAPMGTRPTLLADEEWLPLAENSCDAIISLLTLQWVNDFAGVLAQMLRALKPDGLFFAIVLGGESLRELRDVFSQVEAAHTGGIHPRVSPFLDVRDGGALLQRAGFALPVADSELLEISYPHLFTLMGDLRGAGASNMLHQQVQHFTPRGFFTGAAAQYAATYGDAEGRIPATVELITLTGWKPASTQQQAAPRGSGKISLRDVFS